MYIYIYICMYIYIINIYICIYIYIYIFIFDKNRSSAFHPQFQKNLHLPFYSSISFHPLKVFSFFITNCKLHQQQNFHLDLDNYLSYQVLFVIKIQ